jgi:hypothetical protein
MRAVPFVVLLVVLGSGTSNAQMEISIERGRLVGTGISPGRSGAWFAVEWRQTDW